MADIDRLLVFGDIHSKWDRFQDTYQQVKFDPEHDKMVFLGDYLDRGENPVAIMEWVLAHVDTPNMIFLRGNHEQMFYESLRSAGRDKGLVDFQLDSPKSLWLENGGNETYKAIEKTGRGKELIGAWLELIEKMPLYVELEARGQKYWFVHADCDPELPLEQQRSKRLLWSRKLAKWPGLHQGEQIIVLGHTPLQALYLGSRPKQIGKVVLMDTGSYLEKGHVSCVDLLSWQIWQSNI